MKILVVGSGGREHALAWKIAHSPIQEKIYCAPGNGGIAAVAECVNITADDIKGLVNFAKDKSIDLTIVGPEVPLALGIVDLFKKEGLKIFGPSLKASRLESSKIFAKNVMKKYNVPTAAFKEFNNYEKAFAHVKAVNKAVVIKADGLCAGKGVFVCQSVDEAAQALKSIFKDNVFGAAGQKIIIEECLQGQEASIIVVSDGEHTLTMASSQDHKRIFDEDKGPNTGGMGAYSPAPVVTREVLEVVNRKIINPTIKGMKTEGIPFCGVLYAGVMITEQGPKVLEFNVRFGDPETQTILPRLKTDLLEIMLKAEEQKLNELELEWDERACVCIVVASGGYPGKYEKGKHVKGLKTLENKKDIVVFHAGTKKHNGEIITSGGRVLGVTGLGKDIQEAINKTYSAVKQISFEKMFYRKDIGKKALKTPILR